MRKVFTLVYLLLPSILVSSIIWIDPFVSIEGFMYYTIFVYVITVIGIILFFKFNLCGFWALMLGLLISPLYAYIHDTKMYTPDWINYLLTGFVSLFYTLPFALISLILFTVISIIRKTKGKDTP